MEIRIALNNHADSSEGDVSDDHQCGYLPSRWVAVFSDMSKVMPNRDIQVSGGGVSRSGHINKWGLVFNPENDRPELVINVTLM